MSVQLYKKISLLASLALAFAGTAQAAPGESQERGNAPDKVDVIVTYAGKPDHTNVARASKMGGKVKRAFENLNMHVISVPAHVVPQLERAPGVKSVAIDTGVTGQSASAKGTARKPAKGSQYDIPVSSSVGVAVLDSGIAQHYDLNVANRVNCLVPSSGVGGSFRDEFTVRAFNDNAGSDLFSGDWVQHGETDGATSGAAHNNG